MKDLPLESFNQSYLKKAGVNFKLNVVDTVLKKGFTLSFYLSLILLVLLPALALAPLLAPPLLLIIAVSIMSQPQFLLIS